MKDRIRSTIRSQCAKRSASHCWGSIHREGVQAADLEVVVVGRAWHCARGRHSRCHAIEAHHTLANAQRAGLDSAVIRRQPRMLVRRVYRLARSAPLGNSSRRILALPGSLSLPSSLLLSGRSAQAVRGQGRPCYLRSLRRAHAGRYRRRCAA